MDSKLKQNPLLGMPYISGPVISVFVFNHERQSLSNSPSQGSNNELKYRRCWKRKSNIHWVLKIINQRATYKSDIGVMGCQ